MSTGTAVSTDDLITAAKMNLKIEDYALVDDEEMKFGTGEDLTVIFDGSQMLLTIASQFAFALTGGHFALETVEDDKTVRLNVRDYLATSGDIIGFQSRPRAAASGTQTIYGAQLQPGFNDGIDGASLVGFMAECVLKGDSGDLSGDIRAFQGQITDENVAGRTIDGVTSILDAWHQLAAHTFTGGVHVINVRAPGGATPWSGFAVFPDDGGGIADLASAVTGSPTGVVKIKIGSTVGYIPMYVAYTAA